MRITLAELATHKVFANFPTGSTVRIVVYDRTSSLTPTLSSDTCAEIHSEGVFEWSFANLSDQPTTPKQYVWIMWTTGLSKNGTLFAGGYPDDILEDTGTTLPSSIASLPSAEEIREEMDDNSNIANEVSDVLTDTGTTLPATLTTMEGKIDTVDGVVDDILVDTNDVVNKMEAGSLAPNSVQYE